MKPILKYRGGKSKEIPKFISHIPTDYNNYIEPFFGGGAVYFFLEPSKSIINDINEKLFEFYVELKSEYPKAREQLNHLHELYEMNHREYKTLKELSPEERVHNENENLYYKMRELFNYPSEEYLRSVVYFFINKTSYSGMIRYNKTGEFNVPFGRYTSFNTNLITESHVNLLKRTEIHNKDYKEIFEMANEDDFMFLDPPYDCVFNDYGNLELEDGFNESEHERLAEEFKKLKCKALMIIGKTALTEKLYKDYIVDEYHKNYAVNIRNRFKNDKIHLVIKNYS